MRPDLQVVIDLIVPQAPTPMPHCYKSEHRAHTSLFIGFADSPVSMKIVCWNEFT